MKRIIALFMCISFIFLFGCLKRTDKAEENTHDNRVKIADNLYFENVGGDWQNIFIYKDHVTRYIEGEKYIIKYSYKDGILAYHANSLEDDYDENKTENYRTKGFGGDSYFNISRDFFCIYDIKNNKYLKRFDTQEEFTDYCKKNNYDLFDFRFSNGLGVMDYESKKISDNVKLISFGDPFTQQLLINDNVVFEGYIENCKMTNSNTVEFRLQIPNTAYLEFPAQSNKGITINKSAVSKKKMGFLNLLSEDCYFDGTVTYHIDTKKTVYK